MDLSNYRFSESEINKILKSLVIIIDSKEKSTGHKVEFLNFLDMKQIKYKCSPLKYGDYSIMIPANQDLGIMRDIYFTNKIAIERKANLDEIATNCSSKDRQRFFNEFARAKADGCKMHLLIQNASYEDLLRGNYKSQYDPEKLSGSLHALCNRYDVNLFFEKDLYMSCYYIYMTLKFFVREQLK